MALTALKALGATPVSDERIVHEGDIVTGAGVSAGIDVAMWLAGQIAGEGRAKTIQLAIEYDPHPPFDSGHMSKASAATKAAATALLSKEMIKPTQLKATTALLWDGAIKDGPQPPQAAACGVAAALSAGRAPQIALK